MINNDIDDLSQLYVQLQNTLHAKGSLIPHCIIITVLGPYLCHHRMYCTVYSKARSFENAGPILVLRDKEHLLPPTNPPSTMAHSINSPSLELMFS